MDSAKALRLVQGLLAKAESTHSPHEADALVAKAQALMLEHSIDEMQARQRGETGEKPVVVEFEYSGSDSNDVGKVQVLMAACKGAGVRVVFMTNRRYEHQRAGRVRADGTPVGVASQWCWIAGYPNDVTRAQMLYTSLLLQGIGFMKDDLPARRPSRMTTAYLAAYGARVHQRFTERLEEAAGEGQYGLMVLRDEEVDKAVQERIGSTRSLAVRGRRDALSSLMGAEAGSRADLGDRRINETRRLT